MYSFDLVADYARESLKMVMDTSINGVRELRELSALIEQKSKSDLGGGYSKSWLKSMSLSK